MVCTGTLSACNTAQRRTPASAPAPQVEARVQVIEQYWANGQLKVRREVLRRPDGSLVDHGSFIEWYDNGQKRYEAAYEHGRLHGVETQWHRNGQKSTEQHYRHGLRHGPRYVWDENGTKRKEEHFCDDRPCGAWTVWDKDGRIKMQMDLERAEPG